MLNWFSYSHFIYIYNVYLYLSILYMQFLHCYTQKAEDLTSLLDKAGLLPLEQKWIMLGVLHFVIALSCLHDE